MFGFLKKKLKDAVSSFTKKVEEEGKEEIVEEVVEKKVEEKPVPKKEPEKREKPAKEKEVPVEKEPEEKKGFFKRLFSKKEEKVEEKVEEPVEKEELAKEEIKVEEPKVEEKEAEEKVEEEKAEPIKEVKVEEEKPEEEKAEPTKEVKVEEPKVVEKKPEPKKEKVKEEVKVEEKKVEKEPEPVVEKKLEPKVEEKVEKVIERKEPKPDIPKPAIKEEPKEKKGFFSRITEKIVTKRINKEQFEKMFWDLELALLENNVAVEVIEKLKIDLASELVDKPIRRGQVEASILLALKNSITGLFNAEPIDIIGNIKEKEGPYVICFIGINGTGKTTTIAKMTKMMQDAGLSVVMAACDTFRAAAIDQLQAHADKLSVKLIKHDYGSDPAAVAFDAIAHAKKAEKDVVLIDTAGRLHSNTNLMEELHKIIRIAKPDMKIFIGESVTGNDCVVQAKKFDEMVGIDGIVLSKADVDEKGGAAISVSYVTGKPILFLGTGQGYDDLEVFDHEKLLVQLGI